MGESGAPAMAPLNVAGAAAVLQVRGEERWRHFDDSVNAVSFGFVATAILISMFLVMAIFERFLRPKPPVLSAQGNDSGGRQTGAPADLEAQLGSFHSGKIDRSSPKMSVYSKEVSVVMPGHSIPTFIAHPAPCPPERMTWPSHQHYSISGSTSSLSQQFISL